jgi:hypothetical protein
VVAAAVTASPARGAGGSAKAARRPPPLPPLPPLPLLPPLPALPPLPLSPPERQRRQQQEQEQLREVPLPPLASLDFMRSGPERRLEALVLDRLLTAVLANEPTAQAFPLPELARDASVKCAVIAVMNECGGGSAPQEALAVTFIRLIEGMRCVVRDGFSLRLR